MCLRRPHREGEAKKASATSLVAALPTVTTAYIFRRSTITNLVTKGLPLLAVAQISDTSAEMIERRCGHLCRDAAAEALTELTCGAGHLAPPQRFSEDVDMRYEMFGLAAALQYQGTLGPSENVVCLFGLCAGIESG